MVKTLSNEALRDIERRRDDEDITNLLAYVRHLKRQLAEAQAKVRRQRKNLNALRPKFGNIRFDDWEAEQMRDPEFRAAAEELEAEYQAERAKVAKKAKVTNLNADARA